MLGGKTSNESKAKYNAKTYDRIIISVKKGDKDRLKDHAEAQGESLNAFINRAIMETVARDGAAAGEVEP